MTVWVILSFLIQVLVFYSERNAPLRERSLEAERSGVEESVWQQPEIAQDMYPARGGGRGYISPKRFSPSIHILGDQGFSVIMPRRCEAKLCSS